MALIKCPNCGKTISNTASLCPHCQSQLVSESQRRNSLIAMWLCISGAILCLFADSLRYYFNYIRTTVDASVWMSICYEKAGLFTLQNVAGTFSGIIITSALIVWFLGAKQMKKTVVQAGILICIIILFVRVVRAIFTINSIYNPDLTRYSSLAIYILSIALGLTLFFLNYEGKAKILIKCVGFLYVMSYLSYLVLEHIASYSIPLDIANDVLYFITQIMLIILFNYTAKQSK